MISAIILYFPTTLYANNDVLVVLSSNNSIYSDFFANLNEKLKDKYDINVTYAVDYNKETLNNHKLVISVGTFAAIKLNTFKFAVPVLYTLVTKDFYNSTIKSKSCPGNACYGIYIDQPVHRYIRLINLLFTNKMTIAVPLTALGESKFHQIKSAAKRLNLKSKKISVKSDNNIPLLLKRKLNENDMLLALPDPDIYNRQSARGIILTTYHMNTPIIAYSRAFTKAGALASLFSSIDDISVQTSRLANNILNNRQPKEQGYYPDNFSIEINEAVARSLKIKTPSPEFLKRKIKQ